MTQSDKNTPNPNKERASAPEAGASVTIEASFAIPLFLFAALCLIYLIEIQSIRISIRNAAQSAAKSAAEETAIVPVLNSIKLKSDIVKNIGEDRLSRSVIEEGSSGINCWQSYISPITGEMNIKIEYRVKLPLPAMGSPALTLKEEFRLSAWTGYEDGGMGAGDGDVVYITENGVVYHEDIQCPYLQLSIRFVPYTGVSGLRNEDGGKYYKCEKCVYSSQMAGVYITQYGNKYHNSLNCSGLKRTIRTVPRSEAGGRGGCSKCTE